MVEVQVRPWTGSVLCEFDPEALDADAIVSAVRRHTGVAIVLDRDERHPAEAVHVPEPVSSIRRAVTDAFGELNHEIVRASEGRLDLGALTGLGFMGVGAAEILTSRQVPAPPWFNMAWWAYRTFTISATPPAAEPEPEASSPIGESPA